MFPASVSSEQMCCANDLGSSVKRGETHFTVWIRDKAVAGFPCGLLNLTSQRGEGETHSQYFNKSLDVVAAQMEFN